MKTNINKTQAQKQIDEFFSRSSFSPEQVKKIKRLAMKFNIKLKPYKKQFCKKCLSKLKGKTRITRTHKTITCQVCNFKNKFRI